MYGVFVVKLVRHRDDRQTFTEVFKGIPMRQVSFCDINPLVEKLRHYHCKQTDWWFVLEGSLTLHLHDIRPISPTFGNSELIELWGEEPTLVQIPPMVVHGCSVGERGAKMVYATDREYDPSDEFRIP